MRKYRSKPHRNGIATAPDTDWKKEGRSNPEKCKSCIHRAIIYPETVCLYILDANKRRPCPAGEKCTVYAKGDPLDRSEI